MNTVYPNNLSREKYTRLVLLIYQAKYQHLFSEKQIELPIKLLIDRIDHALSRFKKPEYKQCALRELQNIYKNNSYDSTIAPRAVKIIFDHLSRDEEKVRVHLKDICRTKFPKKFKEEYLDFLSSVTKLLLCQICEKMDEEISQYMNNAEEYSKNSTTEEDVTKTTQSEKRKISPDQSFSIYKRIKFSDIVDEEPSSDKSLTPS